MAHAAQSPAGAVPQLHIQPQHYAGGAVRQDSPHHASRTFPSPHSGGGAGSSLPHSGSAAAAASSYSHMAPIGHQQHGSEGFYSGSPYPNNHGLPTPTSVQFSGDTPEMMSTAQMPARQYPMYSQPQSHSPSSAVSSHGPDPPRGMYSHAPPMQHNMYYQPSYSAMGHLPSSYSPHGSSQQQHGGQQQPGAPGSAQIMTPPQTAVPGQPQPLAHGGPTGHHVQTPTIGSSPRAPSKFDQLKGPRPLESSQPQQQRVPGGAQTPTSAQHTPSLGSAPSSNGRSNNGTSAATGAGGNNNHNSSGSSNAAPGPIPATTPLVIRQDNNGVQWISFEYSKDRVKTDYQIRCDVESVNTATLPKEFKDANCVYPRAHCDASKYQGNRWSYETECNTVGWSLAELNPCLREKRGLIQRAVDSWRNSNQDSRLRSRRVRRMNKQATREKNAKAHNVANVLGPRDLVGGIPGMLGQRPLPPALGSGLASLQSHHHGHHLAGGDGAHHGAAGASGLSLAAPFDPIHLPGAKPHHQHQQPSDPSPSQLRPSNVFHGYPTYPLHSHHSVSIPPPLHSGLEPHLSSHPATTITASRNVDFPRRENGRFCY